MISWYRCENCGVDTDNEHDLCANICKLCRMEEREKKKKYGESVTLSDGTVLRLYLQDNGEWVGRPIPPQVLRGNI